jgi:hypothetical protein
MPMDTTNFRALARPPAVGSSAVRSVFIAPKNKKTPAGVHQQESSATRAARRFQANSFAH